jgi:hypothetical protein
MSLKYAAALSLVAVMTAGVARADTNTADHLTADLAGPAGAKGTLTAEYYPPEKALAFRIAYSGLDGATTAEFDGADGKPVIVVPGKAPIGGSSWLESLTEEQREDMLTGKWTVKVSGPNGAITGRVVALNRGVNP